MMINCPKCGFNQPKDEFCANCGVDMYVYGSARRQTQQKQFGIYIAGAIAVIGLVLLLTGKRSEKVKHLASEVLSETVMESQRLLSARVKLEGLNAPPNSASGSRSGPAPAIRNPQVAGETQAIAPSQDILVDSKSPLVAANVVLADHSISSTGGAGSTDSPQATRLKVDMMLIDSRLAQEIARESHNKEQSGEAEFGSFLDIEKKIKEATAQGSKVEVIEPRRPHLKPGEIISTGVEAKGKNLGFELTIVPAAIEAGSVTLQIEHSFFASAEEKERPQFASRANLKLSYTNRGWETAWIRGVLRHVADEVGQFGASSGILKVLTRAEFLDGSAEFFVIVVPQ